MIFTLKSWIDFEIEGLSSQSTWLHNSVHSLIQIHWWQSQHAFQTVVAQTKAEFVKSIFYDASILAIPQTGNPCTRVSFTRLDGPATERACLHIHYSFLSVEFNLLEQLPLKWERDPGFIMICSANIGYIIINIVCRTTSMLYRLNLTCSSFVLFLI